MDSFGPMHRPLGEGNFNPLIIESAHPTARNKAVDNHRRQERASRYHQLLLIGLREPRGNPVNVLLGQHDGGVLRAETDNFLDYNETPLRAIAISLLDRDWFPCSIPLHSTGPSL
jgi:hypothetical protein